MSVKIAKLKCSRHATQMRGERKKNRPQKWKDPVDSFYAEVESRPRLPRIRPGLPDLEIGFGCRKDWQCFSFALADFVEVTKCMLAILPLERLLELSAYLTTLIADEVTKKTKVTSEAIKSKSDLQIKLNSSQSEIWTLRREYRHLEEYVEELEESLGSNDSIAS